MKLVNYHTHQQAVKRAALVVQERDQIEGFCSLVDERLKSDRAFLFMDGEELMILEPVYFWDEPAVNVLLVYGNRGHGVARHKETLFKLAREIGAVRLVGRTKQPRLMKYYERAGFYEYKVDSKYYIHFIKDL